MRLIDRLSISRLVQMLLDFILTLVDKLKKDDSNPPKRRRKWRKTDE